MKPELTIQNADGSLLWEIPFDSYRFTEELNRDRSASLSFNKPTLDRIAGMYGVQDEFILSGAYRELYIRDKDRPTNDDILYSGYVAEMQTNKGERSSPTMSLASKGFFSLLDKRYTDEEMLFSAQDSAEIAEDLIDYTQALDYGNLGITIGSIPTTKPRDRTFRYDNIKEMIEKMSANEVKDGFDFEVDHTKTFNIYYPKGTYRKNIQFIEGFNIDTYQIRKSFLNSMANQVIVFGKGFDEEMPVEIVDSEDVFKANFFLLQETLSEKGVEQSAELIDRGRKYINTFKTPRNTINISCDYGLSQWWEFSLGDYVRLVLSSRNIDNYYRVTKRSLDERGKVDISFTI